MIGAQGDLRQQLLVNFHDSPVRGHSSNKVLSKDSLNFSTGLG